MGDRLLVNLFQTDSVQYWEEQIHICVVKNDGRDTSKRWVKGRQTLFNCMHTFRLFWLQYKELLYHFVSPVTDLVFIVRDRSFFFTRVYLYSSAYRLIINTPTRHYAGCSRGSPAAFKPGFHLALVPESQHQKNQGECACVHQQSFQRNSPLWCTNNNNTWCIKKNYIPVPGGTDMEKVSNQPLL